MRLSVYVHSFSVTHSLLCLIFLCRFDSVSTLLRTSPSGFYLLFTFHYHVASHNFVTSPSLCAFVILQFCNWFHEHSVSTAVDRFTVRKLHLLLLWSWFSLKFPIPCLEFHFFSFGFHSNLVKMVDPRDKGSESEEVSSRSPNGVSSGESHMNELKKTCADCGTTKTPLWRGGPAGPKSLCNACGIRSRKKRRAVLGVNKGSSDDHSSNSSCSNKKSKKSNSGGGSGSSNHNKFGVGLQQRLLALGQEVLMQRSTVERQRKKLKEEEQAAVLLMALSYGSVYA